MCLQYASLACSLDALHPSVLLLKACEVLHQHALVSERVKACPGTPPPAQRQLYCRSAALPWQQSSPACVLFANRHLRSALPLSSRVRRGSSLGEQASICWSAAQQACILTASDRALITTAAGLEQQQLLHQRQQSLCLRGQVQPPLPTRLHRDPCARGRQCTQLTDKHQCRLLASWHGHPAPLQRPVSRQQGHR